MVGIREEHRTMVNAKPKALVDEDIRPVEHLENRFEDVLELSIGAKNSREELIEQLQGKEFVLTTSRLPLDSEVLTATPELRAVAKNGTGLDNIDLGKAEELGISVFYTPGLNAYAIAEYSVTLLLTVGRHVSHNQTLLQAGVWRDELPLSKTVTGSTIGIIGFGNIGKYLAKLLSGFDVEVLASDPYVPTPEFDHFEVESVELDKLLERSDAVSINTALTEETKGLIGEHEFELMKSTAIIVNTARGPIIDENALIDAVEEGKIRGAGLDVFEEEPLPTDSDLHEYDNILTTPHTAGTTYSSRRRCIDSLRNSIGTYLEGGMPDNQYVAIAGKR